ncbi:MAG: AAA family ATPase [Candidatus Pacebacteria bacterium]|nr:AAA family ATPase [Candidatus Paceibacterota bacterium]
MLIKKLKLNGLLSFGPDTEPLPLQPLNVLIGPNGSGKSNLIEAIGFLRSAATKLAGPMRGVGGGGVGEWIWKGDDNRHASIEAVIEYPQGFMPLRHRIEFAEVASRFELIDEAIENSEADAGHDDPFFYYRFQNGHPALSVNDGVKRQLKREDVAPDESILSQRKDPDQYPELAYLSETYGQIRLYREWSFGRSSVFRSPQSADLPGDRLEEDFSNLGLFLNHLRGVPRAKKTIVEHLRNLYAGLSDFDIRIKGGMVEVFLTEGEFIIPASRLSDGTLRYLCLLAILCDPTPPELICIEEPELGLHPDMLPRIADLLIDASERTQLVVATHSDILVDAMTEQPESVVVMEKHDGKTVAQRLSATDELKTWLDKYRLGELWTKGEIGGTRW